MVANPIYPLKSSYRARAAGKIMIYGLLKRAARPLATGGFAIGYLGIWGLVASPALADTTWPASVSARYKLSFNDFNVGNYDFQSQFNGKTYSASSNASISAMFGAFTWKGMIQSQGGVDAKGAVPQSFAMNYKANKKIGSTTIVFDKGVIKSFAVEPKKPPHPDATPLKQDQLKGGVLDPMTAILAITNAAGGKPCERTVPVFDGKTRFNLVMSYKGTEKVADKKPSGQPSQLVVCNVKYVPLSGHKPKDFVNPWVGFNAIEIALRPVPSANIYVPYRITVPTTIGSAVMSADQITITNSDNVQIALSQ